MTRGGAALALLCAAAVGAGAGAFRSSGAQPATEASVAPPATEASGALAGADPSPSRRPEAASASRPDPARLPTVASINLCTDQLVLQVADPAQIVTLSWLSADPEESTLAKAAARYPLNYGSAEELLRFDPDVVIAGLYTNAFTRALLRELGYTVVDVPPANSLDDIETTLRQVAAAIGRAEQGEALIRGMRARIERHRARRDVRPVDAVVVRPGGFTVEAPSLAHELMTLAGLRNVPAERGLDRWGSLSIETLLHYPPELLIFTEYREGAPSLANTVLAHPALDRLAERTVTARVPASIWSCGLPNSLDAVTLLERAADAARSTRAIALSRASSTGRLPQ